MAAATGWVTKNACAEVSVNKSIPILGGLLLFAMPPGYAQDPQESSSKPADAPVAPPSKPSGKQKKDTATQNASDQPTWDPLRAEKDLEVEELDVQKSYVYAASNGFQNDTIAKYAYASPFRVLSEAQEK